MKKWLTGLSVSALCILAAVAVTAGFGTEPAAAHAGEHETCWDCVLRIAFPIKARCCQVGNYDPFCNAYWTLDEAKAPADVDHCLSRGGLCLTEGPNCSTPPPAGGGGGGNIPFFAGSCEYEHSGFCDPSCVYCTGGMSPPGI